MIHGVFLVVGLFMIVWGVVICGMLISMSLKGGKTLWMISVPGILIVAFLTLNFAGHLFHLPHPFFSHQNSIVRGIGTVLSLAFISLLGPKLYEVWARGRTAGQRIRDGGQAGAMREKSSGERRL